MLQTLELALLVVQLIGRAASEALTQLEQALLSMHQPLARFPLPVVEGDAQQHGARREGGAA